jgi:cell division septum initiation protein DivIVA
MDGQTLTEQRLQELRRQISGARAVPMSASCMVNREETLDLIDRIVSGLGSDFDEYAASHATGDAAYAAEIIAKARQDAARMVSQTEIARGAEVQAAQILARARAESEELLVEADRYVETRLASFEADIQVTMSRVAQMRERLLDRSQLGDGPAEAEAAWPTSWDA